jgi:CDP-diacylglycerol--glycerol-3-phosphate 3-phosphatidyltransferase
MGRGHIPNTITLARILLSPLFIVFFILGGDYFFAAFLVGLLFEITDFLDGAVARQRNQVTGFGKIFDPLADSISRFTVFLCLLSRGYADVFAVALIFYRDALVATVRTFAAYENVLVAARWSGKAKAVVQSVGITAVLLIILTHRSDLGPFQPPAAHVIWSRVIVWVVAAVTAASGVDYIRANWPLIRRFAEK